MLRRVFALVVMALVLILAPGIVHAEPISVSSGVKITGLASDSSRRVYWVSDAAGGEVQAISASGETLGKVTYKTKTSSVQALSLSRGSLWVGDFAPGENLRLIQLSSLAYGAATTQVWQLALPTGADTARALMVSPKGNVYIATDGAKPGIYRASSPLKSRSVNQLTRVADAPAGVTDGAFLSDGNSIALRTSEQIIVMDAFRWTTTASAYITPQPEGQAMSLTLDGSSLLLADGPHLVSMPIPTSIDSNRPTPDPTPSSSAEPSPGSPEPTASPIESSEKPSLAGTYTAIGIALGVSLLAGLAVAIKR